ncbi:MAG TPA: glycosyltransferase family 39 protein [Geobacteraceae bacterium]
MWGRFPWLPRLAVLLPAALSLCMLWRRPTAPGVTMDGVTYLQIARNVLGGKGLGWQALWAAPLHSLLIALTSYLTGIRDLAVAAGIVAPVMGFLLVLAVYFLAAELFDRRTAVVAACLTALFPQLLTISFSTEAEVTYTFFLTFAVALFTRSVMRRSYVFALLAGVSFALAYLSRSEGFLVMLLVLAAAAVPEGRQLLRGRTLRLSVVAFLVFVLTALPYLVFLKQHYGTWVVSPKASYVLIWMKSRIYHDNDKGEMGNEELWGLSPAGKLRWQEPQGFGALLRYLGSHPGKSVAVYLRNLSEEIPGRIPNNSGMERYPQVFPVYLVLAALVAAALSWGERSAEKKRLLFAPFAILLILPVFTNGWWKYLVPYVPLLLVAAARGIWYLPELVARFVPSWNRGWRPLLLVTLVTGALLLRFQWHALAASSAPVANSEVSARRSMAGEAKKAGEWAVRRFGPGRNYMVPWSRLVYYLDGYWTALPVAGIGEIVAYARREKVELLALEMGGEGEAPPPLPGFELVDLYRAESYPYAVAFYRLL